MTDLKRTLTGASRSRTVWLGVIVAVLGFAQDHADVLRHVLTPDELGTVLQILGILIAVLRAVTDRPLRER